MIVDWQYEPIKGTLMHIDLKRIAMDKAMRRGSDPAGRHADRRQDAGRHSRSGAARSRNRVPAGGHPQPHRRGRHRLALGDVLRVSDLPHSGKLKFLD